MSNSPEGGRILEQRRGNLPTGTMLGIIWWEKTSMTPSYLILIVAGLLFPGTRDKTSQNHIFDRGGQGGRIISAYIS